MKLKSYHMASSANTKNTSKEKAFLKKKLAGEKEQG